MEAFGFSQSFINMIEAMYRDIESVLNGESMVVWGLLLKFRGELDRDVSCQECYIPHWTSAS